MKKQKDKAPEPAPLKKEAPRMPKTERKPKAPAPDRGVAPGITG